MPIGTKDFYADIAEMLSGLNTDFVIMATEPDQPGAMTIYSNVMDQTDLAPYVASLIRFGGSLPPDSPHAPDEA